MKISICTLFEKDYHNSVGVLFNSLYNKGFRGIFWVGYRGNLPTWATTYISTKFYEEFQIAEDCVIRFVQLNTRYHLANYKPSFMLELLESLDSDADAIFYFDPDIVNKCDWSFYEKWVKCGIALCEGQYPDLSDNHPRRVVWQEFSKQKGFKLQRDISRFYDAGCVGFCTNRIDTIFTWKKLLDEGIKDDQIKLESSQNKEATSFVFRDDQCVLNLALMLTKEPISAVGPHGMVFGKIGSLMSHAVRPIAKPWQRKYLMEALKRYPPRLADKCYWKNTESPILVHKAKTSKEKKLILKFSSFIASFFKRSIVIN